MKWTKEPPTKDGFYWILFLSGMDPHHQGPMVFDISIDEDGLTFVPAGGDYMQTPEDYEKDQDVKILYWSDEPIQVPKDQEL